MDIDNVTDEEMLDRWVVSEETIDVDNAAKVLKEVKQILDSFGITFFLRQGTCLGAIRDNAFIPWDDDIDVGSVLGLHGITEESLDQVVAAFRNNGFLARKERLGENPYLPLVKSSVRCDWTCFNIADDHIVQFPFLKTPVSLFTQLKEITFIGEKFHVPNPPEEYLRLKYGDEWKTPKKSGSYETDVLTLISNERAQGRAGWLKQTFARYISGRRVSRFRVLDHQGEPVAGAKVSVAGLGSYRTNRRGYARLYIPKAGDYALVIRFGDHEELLYMEWVGPGQTYVYRADSEVTSGRYGVLAVE